MASRYYCSNVAGELEEWSRKLHKLSGEIEHIPSIDKYKLLPQIEELHIIMTELDDRLSNLANACSSVEGPEEEVANRPELKFSVSAKNELFDYYFGG